MNKLVLIQACRSFHAKICSSISILFALSFISFLGLTMLTLLQARL
jgi:hypothetical protein